VTTNDGEVGKPGTRVLSIHADYRCGHSGVCCSSGWEIPVEPEAEVGIRAALARGELQTLGRGDPLRPVEGLPHGARVVLRSDERGRCVFHDVDGGRLCRIHARVGPHALASACRDFPRVVTRTPAGFSITLSHYCPTASSLLFRDDTPLAIEVDPPAYPPEWPYEGLDARESMGPLLRPGVLMGWNAHARWEAHAVETLARETLAPGEAIAILAAQAEAVRAWTPRSVPFDAHLTRCLEEDERRAAAPLSSEECAQAWRAAAECVPGQHPLPFPPPPDGGPSLDAAGIPERQRGAVRRWLAARAFASWLALQGDGLRTTVRGLRLALGVLTAELGRGAAGVPTGRTPADGDLHEAFRRADLILVHLADPVSLAKRLSRGERVAGVPPAAW